MKTKIPIQDQSDQSEVSIPVHYQWSGADGTIYRASSVVGAKSKTPRHVRHAVKTFFRQHRHVQPDTIAYAY